MSTFVKLVLRYVIFSSHERKFLVGVTKGCSYKVMVCAAGTGPWEWRRDWSCWDLLRFLMILVRMASTLICGCLLNE